MSHTESNCINTFYTPQMPQTEIYISTYHKYKCITIDIATPSFLPPLVPSFLLSSLPPPSPSLPFSLVPSSMSFLLPNSSLPSLLLCLSLLFPHISFLLPSLIHDPPSLPPFSPSCLLCFSLLLPHPSSFHRKDVIPGRHTKPLPSLLLISLIFFHSIFLP